MRPCLARRNVFGWMSLAPLVLAANAALSTVSCAQLETRSIALVPPTADLYIGGYEILAPWSQFWNSPAVAGVRDSSFVTKLEQEFRQAWRDRRGNLSRVRSIVENRNTKEALRFLQDVLSKDIFLAADQSLSDFLQRVESVLRKSRLLADPSVSNSDKAELVYGWIDQLGPDWKVPTIILAGSITDNERALAKVDEIEGLLRFGLGMRPEAKAALKLLTRIEDQRGSRLRWRIPFASLPWDAIPTNDIFDAESLSRLREVVADKAIVLTFGILDKRFVFALGDSVDSMLAAAPGASLLDHPDLHWVRDHENQQITGIRYVSDRLAHATFQLGLKDFFSKLANAVLRPATYEVDDSEYREWLLACIDDAGWIDSTIEAHVPEQKGSTEISLLLDHGWEVHAHHRTVNALFDGSSPLRGARHWGRDPLIVLDVQLADHPEYFQAARAIVRRIKQRVEELRTVPDRDLPDARWIQLPEIADRAWPWLFQWAELWQRQVLPSMSGEHVFVLHGTGLESHQWHPDWPRSNEPLAIPGAGLLIGINDSKKWIQSLRGLRSLLEKVVVNVGDRIPASFRTSLQTPESQRIEDGELTTWGLPIPENCPAPKAMMPRVSVGSSWSIFTYSDTVIEGVRTATDPTIGLGQFDSTKNMAKAAWIDLGGLATLMTPWVRYAVDHSWERLSNSQTILDFGIDFTLDATREEIVNAWLPLEKLGAMSSVTTIREDGSSYSRSIFSFGD
jgi:hypothetical protein